MRTQFNPKLAASVEPVVFDFISKLASGETISTATVTASVYTGVDAAPASLVSGAAAISGTQVSQTLTGGVAGVIYQLNCSITTSLTKTLVLQGFLAVESGLQ